ncbi:MAG TPA: hypothetical protein VFP10_12350 [Candidatus Eisenbacteria bacterium]|nr:hypothetical protein [Candidatus Eisenbacteria bacterium]
MARPRSKIKLENVEKTDMAEDKNKTKDEAAEVPGTTDPEETVGGQSFYNAALTGSGTIRRNGTLAEPLPDPTQIRGLGGNRTSGGRLIPSTLDPEAAKVAEVTEAVVGPPPDTSADAGTDESGSTRRTSTRSTK